MRRLKHLDAAPPLYASRRAQPADTHYSKLGKPARQSTESDYSLPFQVIATTAFLPS